MVPSIPPIVERLYYWLLTDAINLLKIFVVAALLVKLVRGLDGRLLLWLNRDHLTPYREQQIRTMTTVMNNLGTALVVIMAGMMALREIGLDVRPILAGAGVIGVAVGFGAQHVVRDLIAGIFILVDDQYAIGDVVRVAGVEGKVESMTLRRTVLRDGEGILHTVPNGEIRVASNLTRTWSQVSIAVPIGSRQPLAQVLKVLEESAQRLAADPQWSVHFLEPPKVLGVTKLSGTHMEVLVQVRVAPGSQFEVGREWRRLIKEGLDAAGILQAEPVFPAGQPPLPPQ